MNLLKFETDLLLVKDQRLYIKDYRFEITFSPITCPVGMLIGSAVTNKERNIAATTRSVKFKVPWTWSQSGTLTYPRKSIWFTCWKILWAFCGIFFQPSERVEKRLKNLQEELRVQRENGQQEVQGRSGQGNHQVRHQRGKKSWCSTWMGVIFNTMKLVKKYPWGLW